MFLFFSEWHYNMVSCQSMCVSVGLVISFGPVSSHFRLHFYKHTSMLMTDKFLSRTDLHIMNITGSKQIRMEHVCTKLKVQNIIVNWQFTLA